VGGLDLDDCASDDDNSNNDHLAGNHDASDGVSVTRE
jgi:hypothetical protein